MLYIFFFLLLFCDVTGYNCSLRPRKNYSLLVSCPKTRVQDNDFSLFQDIRNNMGRVDKRASTTLAELSQHYGTSFTLRPVRTHIGVPSLHTAFDPLMIDPVRLIVKRKRRRPKVVRIADMSTDSDVSVPTLIEQNYGR